MAKKTDLERVTAFVRRARRVALHPIARDHATLHEFAAVSIQTQVRTDGAPSIVKRVLPGEVQFESLVARLRPFITKGDYLYWEDVMHHVRSLTARRDLGCRLSCDQFEREWESAARRDSSIRAYAISTQHGGQVSDRELAYGWLYQDSVHGDKAEVRMVGVVHRYEAAVGVFSEVAIVALELLNYLNFLASEGIIDLPAGTFYDKVVVSDTELVTETQIYVQEVTADAAADSELEFDTRGRPIVPPGYTPMHQDPAFDPTSSDWIGNYMGAETDDSSRPDLDQLPGAGSSSEPR